MEFDVYYPRPERPILMASLSHISSPCAILRDETFKGSSRMECSYGFRTTVTMFCRVPVQRSGGWDQLDNMKLHHLARRVSEFYSFFPHGLLRIGSIISEGREGRRGMNMVRSFELPESRYECWIKEWGAGMWNSIAGLRRCFPNYAYVLLSREGLCL